MSEPRTAFATPGAAEAPELRPAWAGQFNTFQDWVNRAPRALGGRFGSVGEQLPACAFDALGRRCHVGKDFMRARDEGAFPIRYFWQMEPVA